AQAVRGVVQGQIDVHGRHLSRQGETIAKAAVRAVEEADRAVVRRATLLSSLPERRLGLDERQVTQWRRLLAAYDYQRQLERGYSVTRGPDGAVVRSIAAVQSGDALVTEVADGALTSVVASATGARRTNSSTNEMSSRTNNETNNEEHGDGTRN
ncbi:MAG: exodeoxyribonuclease VII large subunit, partial [Acidimicrobiales bacterium]